MGLRRMEKKGGRIETDFRLLEVLSPNLVKWMLHVWITSYKSTQWRFEITIRSKL